MNIDKQENDQLLSMFLIYVAFFALFYLIVRELTGRQGVQPALRVMEVGKTNPSYFIDEFDLAL